MSNTIEFKFSRGESLRFLSHLDQQRVFQRALRRAEMPVAYTQGFNPRPILTFALAMPVGMTSLEEYGRVGLTADVSPEVFLNKMNKSLPSGLQIESAKKLEVEGKVPSLTASITDCLYRIQGALAIHIDETQLADIVNNILERESLIIPKRNKRGKMIEKEVRPFISQIEILEVKDGRYLLDMHLAYISQESIKPELVLDTLNQTWGSAIFDLDPGLKIQRTKMNLKKS